MICLSMQAFKKMAWVCCGSISEAHRQFCRTCGCSLFYYLDALPDILFYYPATLDGGVHPGHPEGTEHHVHVGSKAKWESFEDSLPRHNEELDQTMLTNNESKPACRTQQNGDRRRCETWKSLRISQWHGIW